MRRKLKKSNLSTISANQFDRKFEEGEDIFKYLDLDKAVVVKKVNVDFPLWMVKRLDQEAKRLNVSRQAIIKTWIHDRLSTHHQAV